MTLFRLLLVAMLAAILLYTGFTISQHGWNLLPHFFSAIGEMTWQGQFNFDFMMMLTISGLWTAWRNGFTGRAIALGAVAVFFGIMFLSAYLLYLTFSTNGDVNRILLGVHATER